MLVFAQVCIRIGYFVLDAAEDAVFDAGLVLDRTDLRVTRLCAYIKHLLLQTYLQVPALVGA